jgi:CubicO group peptidase (beta-lactamase class C family)
MKKLIIILLSLSSILSAQNLYFPPIAGNEWETLSPDSLNWCPDSLQALIDYVGNNNSKALLILKDGKLVSENYYNGFVSTDNWYWASAGKTVTAFLVGMAQEEGILDINQPSSTYQGTGWTVCTPQQEQAITVWNQLTMTNGLLTDGVDLDCTVDSCLQYFTTPGSRWYYHNAPYTRLDKVIEGASGVTFNQYYNSRLKNRIGMNGLYLPSGSNNVNFSTPRSMARFGLLLLNKGIWENDTLMQDQAYFEAMTNTSQTLNKSYGYLTWLNGKESFQLPGITLNIPGPLLPDAPDDLFAAMGKDGQYVLVVPSQNLVVIRMGEDPDGTAGLVPTVMANEIMRRIGSMDCSITTVADKSSIPLNVTIHEDFISIEGDSFENLSLIDIQGRLVESSNGITINTSHLRAGIYLLSGFSTTQSFQQKVFIR